MEKGGDACVALAQLHGASVGTLASPWRNCTGVIIDSMPAHKRGGEACVALAKLHGASVPENLFISIFAAHGRRK